MDPRLGTALVVLIGIPAVLVGYIFLSEQVLRGVPERRRGRVRPWLWLAPMLGFLIVFLVYPTIGTFIDSLKDQLGTKFVGLANYSFVFSDPDTLGAIKNNVIWLVLLTALTVGLGLVIAVLVDRVRYESVAKSIIFMPLAISATAASVIWLFMFAYQPAGTPQDGTLNAMLAAVGVGPVPWLTVSDFSFNTILLVLVMAWTWTGFCMVIISSALKGISPELIEAARVDGASELQVFRRITLPLLMPTLFVVGTTMVITALKAFDIVYVMTNGNFDTQVIANAMIEQLFTNGDFGKGSALAIVLMIAIIPIMALNIRRFQAQEEMR
ncbi:MAG TPA: sugar ABC transporter permease [Candidatus Baltobacteraceae bacterium]|nr:sugar ABC transporter permease [Candidatus Baltobacteraceae bacterium]